MQSDDTEPMGYNPHRKMVRKPGDIAIVVGALLVAIGLVLWALFG